ncbi:flagellar type III secretion system pore protein FliP [Romboutsia sp.]|uniref:flagellar type III secretion system pore protein FliP n=1 Tax=Romboutsia sp. TaxID=1965302 RepID=UPI003F359537
MDTLTSLMSDTKEFTPLIELFIILTFLMFLPTVIFMMTSFVRIIITFSFIKTALGAQQSIPNQILIGIAIILTMFIMAPTMNTINENALKPYVAKEIDIVEAMKEAEIPMKEFLLKQTRKEDIKLFVENANLDSKEVDITRGNIPLYVLVPAFAISELKTAFQIGFLIYLPFLLIDLVVSSTLMSMGMFMLPPAMISLPFKLLLFIMVDGWNLLIKSLILSFK